MSAMNIDTPNSGTLEVTPDRIIEFPHGLAGFEEYRRYTLFHPETEDGSAPRYFILQSLDDPAIAFNIADPAIFGFNYEIALTDEESASLDLADPAEAAVVVILVKDEATGRVRANLKGPLILNVAARRGIQHVFSGLNYQVTLKSQQEEQ
jgi:flagellar assembly factor FliW